MSFAVFVAAPYVLLRVTVEVPVTAYVVTVNVADVAPARTVTVAGTEATPELLEERLTTVSTLAARAMVTVPVKVPPPFIDDLLRAKPLKANGGFTVRVAYRVGPG